MQRSNFDNAIRHLYACFQVLNKIPEKFILDKWFSKIEFIPDIALDYIVNRFEDEKDSVRGNIPRTFKEYWQIWLTENPHKRAGPFEAGPCEDCHGRGVLFFEYFNETFQSPYSAVCRCGRCENWKKHFSPETIVPAISRFQLERAGCTIKYA